MPPEYTGNHFKRKSCSSLLFFFHQKKKKKEQERETFTYLNQLTVTLKWDILLLIPHFLPVVVELATTWPALNQDPYHVVLQASGRMPGEEPQDPSQI